ncbi:MAG: peptidoglycan bridge formation glycyltransferase FemA/FemB family protein [Spirochaetaceae bacterium]|nr:MAG: peptidoglycan bridge formation glycyltransferase FemA/FemB family protein [Spirochaetaceae bacterium]
MDAKDEVRVVPIDASRLSPRDNLLQSPFWAAVKQRFGWRAHAFSVRAQNTESTLLVLERGLPGGLSLAYIPHGPDFSVPDDRHAETLVSTARALRRHLPRSCVFVRFDPPWQVSESGLVPAHPRLRAGALEIQPPSTVIVPLADDDEMLEAMKAKTRYNIRLSEKKGVTIRRASVDELDAWYTMYRETATRDRISLHAAEYYRTQFELADGQVDLTLYFAEHESDLLAGIVVARCGKRATYLYGASSNEKRNLMPAYLLQWRAMLDARAAGCSEYDLFGIPPADDPKHPMHGLYRFKTGFGGLIVHRYGSLDYAYRSFLYTGYRAAETARYVYHKKFKKARR